MNIIADYDRVLKESLRDELIWFEDEFEILFCDSENYNDEEISLANQMIH